MASKRISGQERRRSIVKAARRVFARNGFADASVKDIAKAADISEALIYKHFPSKEALYNEVLEFGHDVLVMSRKELERLPPGSKTLVHLTYFLVRTILFDVPGRSADQKAHERLMFLSLIGDTSYALRHFRQLEAYLCDDVVVACFEAAARAGDLVESPIAARNRMWFVHHLAMAVNLCHLSGTSVFQYDIPLREMADHVALFCLRGMGLTDQAIRVHFQPDELRAFVQRLHRENSPSLS